MTNAPTANRFRTNEAKLSGNGIGCVSQNSNSSPAPIQPTGICTNKTRMAAALAAHEDENWGLRSADGRRNVKKEEAKTDMGFGEAKASCEQNWFVVGAEEPLIGPKNPWSKI